MTLLVFLIKKVFGIFLISEENKKNPKGEKKDWDIIFTHKKVSRPNI